MMWDDRYSEPGFAYGTEPNDYLREMAHHIPAGGAVLSLAEGEGRNAVWLAQQGFVVTAMDGSAVGLRKAAALAHRNRVPLTCQLAELGDYSIEEGAWDGIIIIWVPMPSELRHRVLRGCIGGLKPGGVLIIEAYGPRQPEYGSGGPSNPDMLPSLSELQAELDGLRFIHAQEIDRVVLEGRYHTGMSAVIQTTAVKPLADR